MKKFYIVLLNILLLCLLIFPQKTQSVFARSITSNWVIAEDTQIDGETDGGLLIEGVQSGSAIVIGSGANVTLKNLTINIAEGQTLSSVISIEAGAKLILEKVSITLSSKPTHAIIANEGMLEIDNCVFPNITSLVIIDNNTNEVGSLLLHNVAENTLARIKLSQGSIYVDKSTSIDGVINVCIDKTYDEILQSGERYIGRAIVKGIDTFAGKFLENFQFDGAPNESEIDSTSEYLFENFKDELYGYKYYLDYVGYLGDDLDVYNDGYSVTYNDGENDIYVDTINSGDIILTQFCVNFMPNNSQTQSIQENDQYKQFFDNGVVNVGGKYATARLFLKFAQNEIDNFYVYGTILKKNNETGAIASTTQEFVLDNFTTLLGKNSSSKQNYINYRGKVSFQPLNVKTFSVGESGVENALETQTLKVCPSVLINPETDPDVFTSNYLAYVDLNGYLFEDIVAGEGLNVTRLISTQDYEILNIELGESFSGDVKINLKEKTSTKNVSLAIENSDLTYNSLDQISNCTPYYMDGENKVYLQNDEFKIYKVENDTQTQTEQIINAGDYKIVVCESEGFVFENTEFDVTIRPIGLTIEYTKTNFVYDGEAKFVEAEVTGVLDDDVEISYNNNGQILPGNYTITAEIASDTNNYYILDACKKCTLFIDKATIDMSQVVVEDRIVEYTGEKFSITPKNLVEGLEYRCSGPYSDVGTYPIQITFLVSDLNLYYPLKDNENIKKVELTITPKIIDLSYIEFSDIHHTYDGTAVNVEVSQEVINALPNEVSKEITINGDGVANASDTPYDVTIVFKLNANYLKNYSLSPATHTCKIYIHRATIDESVFVFEDLTVEYDGEKHLIDAKNIPDVIQCENTTG